MAFGSKSLALDEQGQRIEEQPRHPIMGEDNGIHPEAPYSAEDDRQGSQISGKVLISRSIAVGTAIIEAMVIWDLWV